MESKGMRRPILPIAALVVAGILVGKYAGPSLAVVAVAACCGVILFPIARIRRAPILEYAAIALLLAAVGVLLQARGRATSLDELPGRWYGEVTGVLEGPPETRRIARVGGVEKIETEEEETHLAVRAVDQDGAKTPWLVTAYVPGRIEAEYGELLRLRGTMRLFPEERNPGQLDYRDYLLRKKVIAGIRLPAQEAMTRLGRAKGNPLKGALLKVKEAMRRGISKGLDDEGRRIMGAMVLGERRGVRGALRDDFIRSGTAHVLTVSGFHVGVVALFAWAIMRLLRAGIVAQAVAVCLVAVGYAALTGFAPASLRAAAMICSWRGAVIVRRRADGLSTLAFALLVVLAALGGDELFSPGLQLSFAAVTAIVVLSPKLERMMGGGPPEPWEMLLPKSAWQRGVDLLGDAARKAAAIGAAAWVGITPIMAYHFHIITPAALIENLFVVPLAGIVIPLGLVAGAAGAVFHGMVPLAVLLRPFLWLLRATVGLLAKLPGGHFYTIGPSAAWVALFFAMFALGVWRRKLRISTGQYALAALLLTGAYTWQGVRAQHRDELEYSVLDIGAGLATCMLFPEGEVILFDAGSRNIPAVGERVVAPFLWERGVRRVDLLLLSHTHSDHTSGVAGLLERVPVSCVGVPVGFDRSETGKELLALFRKKGIEVLSLGEGDVLRLGDTTLHVLNPPKDPELLALLDENERSMVVDVAHERGRFLFTGDAANFAMRRLLQRHAEGTWDVVVLPHHGLNPEAAADFIDAVRPQLALASYIDTPPAMEGLGVATMDTASFGAITIRSSPAGLAARGHLGGEVLAPKARPFDIEAAGGTIKGLTSGGATQ